MSNLRPEVQHFVEACEGILSFSLTGGTLTENERDTIEMAAIEVLGQIHGQSRADAAPPM
jgi:hypothetical protein